MKLKEEWHGSTKNKGEPLGPPSFLFEPCSGARVGSHRCPILRLRFHKYIIHGENRSTFVTVLIRRLGACESLRLPASSRCPLDLVFWPGVKLIMERLGVPQDDRIDFIGVGPIAPERGRDYRLRASTKGRVEARSHVEKNDRTDLVEEFVTR